MTGGLFLSVLICAALIAVVFAKKNAPFTGNFEDLPTLAGAQVVGAGFNARTGQSGLSQILTYTYTFNQTWQSPGSGVVYKVPDQLMIADNSYSSTKVCLVLSESFDLYWSTYFSMDVFYGLIPLPGVFAAWVDAKELADAQLRLQNNLTFYGLSIYNTMFYSLDMAPAYNLQPSATLRLSIAGLPTTFSDPSDLQRYQEFVTSYGTHYVCFADMGGTIHSSSYINSSIATSMGITVTAEQMVHLFALEFFSIFTAGFPSQASITFASWFLESQQSLSYFYGGNPAYQSNATLAQWLLSLPDTPSMLNKTLCPLSMLITDATKKASLEAYIEQYVNAPPSS